MKSGDLFNAMSEVAERFTDAAARPGKEAAAKAAKMKKLSPLRTVAVILSVTLTVGLLTAVLFSVMPDLAGRGLFGNKQNKWGQTGVTTGETSADTKNTPDTINSAVDSGPETTETDSRETLEISGVTVTVLDSSTRNVRRPVFVGNTGVVSEVKLLPMKTVVFEVPGSGLKGIALILTDEDGTDSVIYSFTGAGFVCAADYIFGNVPYQRDGTMVAVFSVDPVNAGLSYSNVFRGKLEYFSFSNMNDEAALDVSGGLNDKISILSFAFKVRNSLKQQVKDHTYDFCAYVGTEDYKAYGPGERQLTQEDLTETEEKIRNLTSDVSNWDEFFAKFPKSNEGISKVSSNGQSKTMTEFESVRRTVFVQKYDPATKTSESVKMTLRISRADRVAYNKTVPVTMDALGAPIAPEEGYAFTLETDEGDVQVGFINYHGVKKPESSATEEYWLESYGFICFKDVEKDGMPLTMILSYRVAPDKHVVYGNFIYRTVVPRASVEYEEFYITNYLTENVIHKYGMRPTWFGSFQPTSRTGVADLYNIHSPISICETLSEKLAGDYFGGDIVAQKGLDGRQLFREGTYTVGQDAVEQMRQDLYNNRSKYFPGAEMIGGYFRYRREGE